MTTVTFAGSGDAFGSGGRFQACIHVQPPKTAPFLLDCGATSLTALKSRGLDPHAITHVVVSHLHVDHFGGLPHLILDGQFSRRTAPLTVAGPLGTRQRLIDYLEVMFPGSSTVERKFPVTVVELEPGATADFDGFSIRSWDVNHGMIGGPFLSLQATVGDRRIGYTGDTAWTQALSAVAAGTDLFIAEAYFWDKPVPYHLRHADLLEHRHELHSSRTILTHMSADMLANLSRAEFEAADDGLTISLGSR